MKKKNIKSIIMVIMMTISIMVFTICAEAAVPWPSFSSSKPIKVYTISTGNNTTSYTNSNLNAKIGTIYASDELHISYIGRNYKGQWYCYLTYPISGGRRKAGYLPLSAVTGAVSPSGKYTSRATFDSYRRASSAQKAGAVYRGDTVYKLTTSGAYTQVLYNIGSVSSPSGWRMAWVTTSNFDKYIKNTNSRSYNPEGCVDAVTSNSEGTITVQGWTFDRDNVNSKLAVHVYVGGPAGSGIPAQAISADKCRTDVNRVYPGVGNYHGFDNTIRVNRSGYQVVYIYAINVGSGNNVLIGSRGVTIKGKASVNTNMSQALYKNSNARLTCGFNGYRNTRGKHEGIDFSCYVNAPVYSLTDGTIIRITKGYNGSRGLSTIAIYDSISNKTVIYLHSNPLGLRVGQKIIKGQKIATQGWRGCSSMSGSHTHVEVRNGRKTSAAKSVNDYNLENPNPTSYWNSKGYAVK